MIVCQMKILYFIQDILYALKIVYYNLFFVHLFLNLKTQEKILYISVLFKSLRKNILKLLIYCFKMIAFNFGFILLGVKIMAIISFYLLSRNKI